MVPVRFNVAMARRNLSASPWREAAGDNGDLHRLFLEQRYAERLVENGFQLFFDGYEQWSMP